MSSKKRVWSNPVKKSVSKGPLEEGRQVRHVSDDTLGRNISDSYRPRSRSRSSPLSKSVSDSPEIEDIEIDIKKVLKLNIDVANFKNDLAKEVEDGTLDYVDNGDDHVIYTPTGYEDRNYKAIYSPDEEDVDSEQPGESPKPGRLFTGRASYRNLYSDPKSQEEETWNEWETFSAISGMGVQELVRKAELGDLILDRRALSRLQKRFLSMQKVYKRQYYQCGERYVIPEQIRSWSEDCSQLGIKAEENNIGDDSLNQKVSLMHGDITALELDVVVNSISSHVTDSHEGVSRAIVQAASTLVKYELESIWVILVGEVAATAGYLLPAKYIFHTSGPTKHDSNYTEHLQRCYRNCLEKMKDMGLRTLAFPCVATGAKNLNIKQAAMTALTTVKYWMQENKDSVDKIIFCVYDVDNWACYQELMPTVFPPGPKAIDPGANLIPTEILRMDKNSVELYKRALSEGKEAVHNIRVMVVGHYGVGKTTLTKRMFGEDVDISNRESTEGIDVHVRKCKVSLETGQWNIVDKDEKKETMCRRLIKFLKNSESIEKMTENKVPEADKAGTDGYDIVDGLRSSMEENASIEESENNETEDLKHDYIPDNATLKESSGKEENHDIDDTQPKEEYILNHLKALIDEIKQHSIDSVDSNSAALSLWDFAGQFVFYATHQVFLSRRAVYLLVTDISKHVQDLVQDDDIYMDGKGVNHWKISEFVDFWLNSIHEFCNSPDEDGPPAILIGTFADKLEKETKAKTLDEFFYALRSSLVDQATSCHLIDEDFAMDNTTVDANIEKLKQKILDTASKQSYWGELIPAKWITLENIILTLKEDDMKILTKDRLHDLNSTLPVPIDTKDELDLFLRFHHESGNLLYFSDEKLHDSIVLEPQWLIDAFKSLITAKMFCCRRPKIFKKWLQFDESAILTKDLVDAIWEKEENVQFHQYKDLLLDYLEKLGLIAKPIQQPGTSELADYYFAPCVLKTPPPEEILKCDHCSNQRSSSKLCFETSSGFLPTAVFNKLLAACISRWPLSKRNGKPLIFCGCGVFDLQDNHTVYLYFFNHVIQIWLTKLSTTGVEPDQIVCSNVRDFVSDILRTKFKLSSSIEISVKCPQADLCSSGNSFAIDCLAQETEVVCSCGTSGQHVLRTIDMTKYWQCSSANPETDERVPTDKEISRIAHHIGTEYMSLGLELGLSKAELDHINLDFKTTVDRITTMLIKWKLKEVEKATLENLGKALEIVGADTEKALACIRKTDANYST